MVPDTSKQNLSEQMQSGEFTSRETLQAFQTEILEHLYDQNIKDNEAGGHPEHPLGEHPTLWMDNQYRAARYRAIKSLRCKLDLTNLIEGNKQFVYPSYLFIIGRLIIGFIIILRKRHRASYPIIRLSELFFLQAPTHLLNTFRYWLAKIKMVGYSKKNRSRF